jgi:large subunit ribosomal protein L23
MNPYQIIKSRRLTEKSRVLENLKNANSNPSIARCKSPKYVFDVHFEANKTQIAEAVELIYAEKKIKVVSVNTINRGGKWRKVRGFTGKTASLKKAIVTLRPGDEIDEQV